MAKNAKSAKSRYVKGGVTTDHLSFPAKIAVVAVSLVVLVTMASVFIVLPLQEKEALIKAGLAYKNGAPELGTYEQDGDESNGPEAIVWRVLKISDDEIYLVAKEGLDVRSFNSAATAGNSWETSELKAWLQGEFAQAAGLNGENITVTLPTTQDIKDYFDSGADSAVMPTDYTASKNPTLIQQGAGTWWLRDAGTSAGTVAVVGVDGSLADTGKVNTEGVSDTTEGIIVRPALIISMK